jgi:hypothetical protein
MEEIGGVVERMRVVAVEISKQITHGIQVQPVTCQHLSVYLY